MSADQSLVQLLAATLDPAQQKRAAAQLDQMYRVSGLSCGLLHVVTDASCGQCVQQAAAICLKNLVVRGWHSSNRPLEPGEIVEFSVAPHDKTAVRAAIVQVTVRAAALLRQQLLVCVKEIVRADFPDNWPTLLQQLISLLQQTDDVTVWPGALHVLHQLVKCYEFRDGVQRAPLVRVMQAMTPLLQHRLADLLPNTSEDAVLTQKLILKIYHAFINYQLHVDQIPDDSFTRWMQLVHALAGRAMPAVACELPAAAARGAGVANDVNNDDDDGDDERPRMCWWKCRKWALNIMFRTFDRYGRPGKVLEKYQTFAKWYVRTFTGDCLRLLLSILDSVRHGQYITPRVLQFCLKYINCCVLVAIPWSILREHIVPLIKHIVFPLLCFNNKDARLWRDDPHEFIRLKYDPIEDFVSPVLAARAVLRSLAARRKQALHQVMQFVVQVLTSSGLTPQHKDGALHLVGSVSETLCTCATYRDQMENMLVVHVFPDLSSQHPHLRARACWMLQHFCELQFGEAVHLAGAVGGLVACLLSDDQLPVQVEAAVALQHVLQAQPTAAAHLEQHVQAVLVRLLNVIGLTDNQELTTVLQAIVGQFSRQLAPVAVQLASGVVAAFEQMVASGGVGADDELDDKMAAAMGLVGTMDLLVEVWEDDSAVCSSLEPVLLRAVILVLDSSLMDLYDDVFRLVASLTGCNVSAQMWRVFEKLYKVFEEEGYDFFEEMMPALYNFVVVDCAAFAAVEARVLAVLSMCRTALTVEPDKSRECLAVKLLECLVMQCRTRIIKFLPAIVQLVVERMSRPMSSNDLRIMCLQTLIAVLYTEPELMLHLLSSVKSSGDSAHCSLLDQFINQWLSDHHFFSGLHDGKMYVLGWCVLLRVNAERRPAVLNTLASQIIPALISVLLMLCHAYQDRAIGRAAVQSSSAALPGAASQSGNTQLAADTAPSELGQPPSTSSMADHDDDEENVPTADTECESDADGWACDDRWPEYTTCVDTGGGGSEGGSGAAFVDEFVLFAATMRDVQQREPHWYSTLTGSLTDTQVTQMTHLLSTSLQISQVTTGVTSET